jgi:hypothetical protein
MRLAIADPPYPPFCGVSRKVRASRWYGSGQLAKDDVPADVHPNAAVWDDPARHRELLMDLVRDYDGWAIATTPDGIAAYGELPAPVRLLAWVRPSSQPGAHVLQSRWEAVILFPPDGRRSNRNGRGCVPDALIAAAPRNGFIGAKPREWTTWVLDALSYDPAVDTVTDIFPGSGAVAAEIAQLRLPITGAAGTVDE